MSKRYIDEETLLKYLKARLDRNPPFFGWLCARIATVPSADVVEVKRGEWVYNPHGMDWGLGAWECSECHVKNDNLGMSKEINPYLFAGGQYCPHCGAKMERKGESNAR